MKSKRQFETLNEGLLVWAPAKINLSLLVAGKRPDGYHEIETIMAKINLYDEILIERSDKAGVELVCRGEYVVPAGRDNLVTKAAELLLATCNWPENVKITLTKNMPAGSGLGSGSSDAAATLMGLNEYLKLGLSTADLAPLATQLGSDMPFFLGGSLALCKGKGEIVLGFSGQFDFLGLLVLPDISVSTKKVYANYKHDQRLYEELKREIDHHILANRLDLVAKMCANMLAESCYSLEPDLVRLKEKIESCGPKPLCLSGSGSTMFWVTAMREEELARRHQRRIEDSTHCRSIIVTNNPW
jgi:4-diphosphocytidyl-2-C-methyl-D-erythritol kinase